MRSNIEKPQTTLVSQNKIKKRFFSHDEGIHQVVLDNNTHALCFHLCFPLHCYPY